MSIPCTQAPTAEQAAEVSSELLSSYYAGELDRIELLFTSFISMVSSVPSVRTLIPLLPSGMEMEGDEIFKVGSSSMHATTRTPPRAPAHTPLHPSPSHNADSHAPPLAPALSQLTSKEGNVAVEKTSVAVAEPKEFAPDMIFEQEPSQLLNALLPLYLNGQLLRTLQESVASELASRMSAMQAATDNAKDLQGRLEGEMNRARQAKITQELMEIVAGADATN